MSKIDKPKPEIPTPAEVKRMMREETESLAFHEMESRYKWMAELILDSEMRPVRWGCLYRMDADLDLLERRNALEGFNTVFIPIELAMPGLSDDLNFHRLYGEAEMSFRQHSFQLVSPPAKRTRRKTIAP